MTVAKHIPQDIKRASRAIGFALWLENSEQWSGLAFVLRARLSSHQRASLALAALLSLNDDEACQLVVIAMHGLSQQEEAA